MADQFIGRVLAEKYRVDSTIREGDFASLYHGTHLLMEKPVTIKILSPRAAVWDDAGSRFANEARTVSRIFHQNILNVTDYGSDQFGTPFIVFEGAEGITLKEAIETQGAFSPERANKVVKQIAAALSAAHKQGLTHLNLRSDNVFLRDSLGDTEEVKVFNFGLGRLNNADSAEGLPPSKAAYLSPEQCSPGAAVDERSDIYSLGVILYEMLSGHLPFSAQSSRELTGMHLEQLPPPLADFGRNVPSGVEETMLRALAKNPGLRYQSVSEFADDLNRATPLSAFSTEEETIIQSRPGAVIESKPENNIWKTAFIVLAGISLLGGGLIYMTSVKQTNPGTALATDANGQPVQPVNPSTGTVEQGLSNMSGYNPDLYGNSNIPGVIPGGDGYDPWGSGRPPVGAPSGGGTTNYGPPYPVPPGQISPGGQVYTIDPNNPSVFMQQDGNVVTIIQPVNANNANAAANKSTTKGNKPNTNTNTSVVPPANTNPANVSVKPPAANTTTPTETKTTPAPKPKTTRTPAKAPAEQPKAEPKPDAPPAATDKRPPSGKNQDTN